MPLSLTSWSAIVDGSYYRFFFFDYSGQYRWSMKLLQMTLLLVLNVFLSIIIKDSFQLFNYK